MATKLWIIFGPWKQEDSKEAERLAKENYGCVFTLVRNPDVRRHICQTSVAFFTMVQSPTSRFFGFVQLYVALRLPAEKNVAKWHEVVLP